MLYRETGQFKTSYTADMAIFTIRQDRIALWLLLALAFIGVPLLDAAEGKAATCVQRYPDFIDHIVLDAAAAARRVPGSFVEFTYGVAEDQHPSDHCPVSIRIE